MGRGEAVLREERVSDAAPTRALNRGTEPGGEAALARAASYCQGPRGLI